MSHTLKIWERVVEARLRQEVEICQQLYGFMPRKSTTGAIFALRMLIEKYGEGQSGVAEKYVRLVQGMYENSTTVVRCAVGTTGDLKVEVGLHQGLALSPLLFALVMDR